MAVTDTPLDQLIINVGTKAQVDQAIREGRITEDMLTVVTDQDIYVVQVTEMPVASIDELGRNYQYVGVTDQDYTYGYFYKCIANGTNPETYSWQQFNVQPETDISGKVDKTDEASIVYGTDSEGNQTTYNMTTFGQIDNVAIHGVDQTITDKRVDLSVVEQVESLPAASENLVGRVVQYTGSDTQDLVHNYFYECKLIYTDETRIVKSASTQLTVSADFDKFAQSGLEYNTPYLYEKHGAYWDCIDPEGITISGPNAGLVTGGIVNSNDQVILQVDRELFWKQVNVQPETILEWGNISGTLSNQTDLQNALDAKQDTLTAGTGIDISTDASTGKLVISSTSSESFYRGTFATWNLVPTNPTNYVEDPIHHLKTPSNTDYMIVTDASDYYKPGAEITIQFKGYVGGTGYVLELSGEWSDTLIAYNTPYERVYGNNELIINFAVNDGAWSWRVRFNIPVVLNGTRYDAYDVWTGGSSTATRVFNEIVDQPCEGTWRFGYYGEWDTVGRNGWVAEYKIEDTLPIATDTVAGITKLYTTTGSNTDGTMDQNSITTELDTKATVSDLSTHTSDKNNPHEVTKAQVGLGNVDNTADLDKPISTATQSALDTKVEYAAKIITWTEVEE